MHWLLICFKINRDVSLQAFLFKNKVFSEVVQYDFEPYRHDNVSTILNLNQIIHLLVANMHIYVGRI